MTTYERGCTIAVRSTRARARLKGLELGLGLTLAVTSHISEEVLAVTSYISVTSYMSEEVLAVACH